MSNPLWTNARVLAIHADRESVVRCEELQKDDLPVPFGFTARSPDLRVTPAIVAGHDAERPATMINSEIAEIVRVGKDERV
ncbi:hypothetical protein [Nocardia sp. Marseille-Q1738]